MAEKKNYEYQKVEQKIYKDIKTPQKLKRFGVRHVQTLVLFLSLSVAYSMRAQMGVSIVAMTSNPCADLIVQVTNKTEDLNATEVTTEAFVDIDIMEQIDKNYLSDLNFNDNTTIEVEGQVNDNTTKLENKVVTDKGEANSKDSNNIILKVIKSTEKKLSKYTNDTKVNAITIFKECEHKNSVWNVYRTYNWPKKTQEMILFSFWVGYTIMMIPMGIVAQRCGGKIPIMIALGVNGVISLLTPWMPMLGGWITLAACRLCQGFTQAAFYPSIHTLLSKWAPLCERGRLSTYVYTGTQFGTIIALQIAGFFAGSPSLGWPFTFWVQGATSLVCLVLLWYFGAATPHDHPTISAEELAYITNDIVGDVVLKKRRTPWRQILTSKPVWGIIITHSASSVGALLVLNEIPIYMDKILGVNIKQTGLLSSLPYIAMYFMTLAFGFWADFCNNRKIMSIANIRRTANTIGIVVSGLFMVGFAFVHTTLPAVILLILCLGTHSGIHVGFHINQIDLAPNFAGQIMAFGNMVANLTGLLVPVLISNIIQDDVTNQGKWQIVFLITFVFLFFANIVFVIFVKDTVQPWNFYGEEEDYEEDIQKVELRYANSQQTPAVHIKEPYFEKS